MGPAYWPAFASAAGLLLLQTMLEPFISFRGAVPSLVTIPLVLYCLRVGARRGARLALPIGLLEDIFAGTGGAWTIATTIVGLCAGGLSRRVYADGAFVPAVLCALAVLLRNALFWALMHVEGYPVGFAVAHLHQALWSAALTALVAFLFLVVRGRLVADKTTIHRYA